ncbi:MAG: methionyl-tRNA formyltransferase, partial [Candidatus Omnitrophica bacterium]|nr:methionyl-tRNA formyltransferase [Candidatus Omnitrophota bacterium]
MNIVFFGTDKFAINSLEAIYNSKHKIVSIVTAPDAKRGRGLKETFTDIKRFALNYRLNILQPRDPNSNTFIEIL